jgi:hypothetical protein
MSKDQVVNTSIDGDEGVKRALIPGYLLNANHWFDKHKSRYSLWGYLRFSLMHTNKVSSFLIHSFICFSPKGSRKEAASMPHLVPCEFSQLLRELGECVAVCTRRTSANPRAE